MTRGVKLVMLGRQGAGKGTQCVRLSRHYVVPHVSTGDMLRAAVKEGSPLGLKAKEYMDAGDLLPDDLVVQIIDGFLNTSNTTQRGFILDGFPRTVAQAGELRRIVEGRGGLDLVVNLEVPTDVVLDRLASRRVCTDCGANYSTSEPPKNGWVCDDCGGDVVQRDDDTEEAISRRLALYEKETAPLVDWYRDAGLLAEIDGLGDAAEVTERVVAAIEDRMGRSPA
ncbi:MAG TPA: adenylate kinase [Acidimicrobiales bacterium]|jgi:adenylate kinase|nr:adenylate kinase [Acidimicrobiales bacterium]